jgi:phosphoglucosamine mutase
MQALKNSGQSLKDLSKVMEKYPQVLINVPDVAKEGLEKSKPIAEMISAKNRELKSNGRILVRASGTENLIRVMVEASTTEIAEEIAQEIAALVRSELSKGSSVT